MSGDPKMEGPASPMTALMQGAAQIHEIFTSYVAAGFNRREALYLVGQILTASMQHGASGTEGT